MTIEQIQTKQTELEAKVKALVEQFELETGTLTDIHASRYGHKANRLAVVTTVTIPRRKPEINEAELQAAGF